MSSLGNRLSRLEARVTPNVRVPVTVKVFDPLTMDNIEERIAEAERDAAASGHRHADVRCRPGL